MTESPSVTTTALLEALSDSRDAESWRQFDERYRPIVFQLARRVGLADEDAADAAQETMLEFVRDFRRGRYERERGRLRHWIMGIARNRARDVLARRRRNAPEFGDTWLATAPDEPELERLWDAEVEDEILRRALVALRGQSEFDERSVQVFEAYVVAGEPPDRVAARHELAVGSVYAIKSRCLKRLTELREVIAREFEGS